MGCSCALKMSILNPEDCRLLRFSGLNFLKIIGNGKYSTVYHAVDRIAEDFPVAVKVTDTSHLTSLSRCDAAREAVLWKDTSHPNIPTLYAAFHRKSRIILLLEYVEGGNLLQHMMSLPDRLVEKRTAECWTSQLAEAVGYLHDNSIAHRDIKLENVLVSQRQRLLKLGDFGFAKKVAGDARESRCCGSTSK